MRFFLHLLKSGGDGYEAFEGRTLGQSKAGASGARND
ncbi:hypothetical protein [Coxiella burnetii]|uniref:Uncharacterized protein n=2 Tax=Coxiella burnetii TaxID=777 RepID=Q83DH2_COXBU|nr:hypothetical protein [Coxiella burnetii]NP_819785.1 hypothetical protein CBU_0761 [Coxiella burnetii RSA 493]AAO90299.1 hypothetical protein CBU_0761 [Coxiella burnetii RSA 493]ACI23125.1 hypothetical protein CBUD_0774a [Coxiella burnetii Dugway 5J108-111]ACJ18565.1 hypothetical protein CbuG_1241 [Coxiella burnetii CbuG_Q212]ACJ19888.1 hypothetical protein CbuK_0621 [Coxiella burnetii CbuK_Q154]ARI65599.1 hypothetical protein B7L74_03860 [Coxiella burnetii]